MDGREREEKCQRLEHQTVYRGRILTLEVDRIREPWGKEVEREVVRHSGAAVMVALTGERRLVLVRQYRYAVDELLWEVPAGTVAPGESPEETARRELVEETGFFPRSLKKLAEVYPSPGFSDELMHLFLATELEERSACPEEDETIEVKLFSLEEILGMASQGRIRDGKTLLGLMLLRSIELGDPSFLRP
jgi:ADP-ribose pyrophosphatase